MRLGATTMHFTDRLHGIRFCATMHGMRNISPEDMRSGLSRRSFLASMGVFAAASAMSAPMRAIASLADTTPLPEYWKLYIDAVAGKVRAIAEKTADGFWFITDLHITANRLRSGKVLTALASRTPLTKVLCGGDLPEAFAAKFDTDKAGVDYAVNLYRSLWVEPVESAGMKMYTAKGNHDFTIRHDAKTNAGFTLSGIDARNVIMGSKGCSEVVTNAADPEACYYYFDNATARIRYITVDTTDSITDSRSYWAVVSGMHDTQLLWLAEHAFSTIPAGWSVVVMHHIPFVKIVGNEHDAKLYSPFRTLMEAYQHRKAWTHAGRTFDFSAAQGRILLDITGHYHAERQTYLNGILYVTEPCDAAYGDYIIGSAPWCGDLPRKDAGTVNEQTFDAVQLDPANDLVYFTRVGGGQDRVIHARPLRMKEGETLRIDAKTLSGPLTWGCYDADRLKYSPNPKNRYVNLVSYYNDIATIAPDGVLTAKKPGEIMVLAMDAGIKKEIFPVTVTAA